MPTTTIEIQPVKLDGKFFANVTMDGEVRRHGPYIDADAAESVAGRLLRVSRALTSSRLNRGNNHG